jgi:hypothetical protein
MTNLSLTDRERDLLRAMVTAAKTNDGDATTARFAVTRNGGLEHLHWPSDVPKPTDDELRPLRQRRILVSLDRERGSRDFALSTLALEVGQALGAEVPSPPAPFPDDLSWLTMIPVLEILLELHRRDGGPGGQGVRLSALANRLHCPPRDDALLRALELLESDGYLTVSYVMPAEASSIRPLPRTLHLLRDWPSTEPDNIARILDKALADAIEQTTDPDEKTRLQRLRDNARDVGKSVLAGAVLAAGKYAVGGGV